MEQKYKVIFSGNLTPGLSEEEVKGNLSGIFKGHTDQIDELFTGNAVVVKNNADADVAEKYRAAFAQAGALCDVVEIVEAPPQDSQVGAVPISGPSPSADQGGMAKDAAGSTPCAECGKRFYRGDMISYEGNWVCETCKPIFVQKLREGVTLAGDMTYAGFWIRFGAKFIDGLILGAANMVIGMLFAPMQMANPENMSAFFAAQGLAMLIQMAIGITYSVWFIGKFAATPGKMVCKIKVVTDDGGKVSYARALGRYFSEMLSAIILMIGYVMAAFDDEKRALHDRICSTRVIKK